MLEPIKNHIFFDVSLPLEIRLCPSDPGYEDFKNGVLDSDALYDIYIGALKRKIMDSDAHEVIENVTSVSLDLDTEFAKKQQSELRRAIAQEPAAKERHVLVRSQDETLVSMNIPERWLNSAWAGHTEIERARSWLGDPELAIVRI